MVGEYYGEEIIKKYLTVFHYKTKTRSTVDRVIHRPRWVNSATCQTAGQVREIITKSGLDEPDGICRRDEIAKTSFPPPIFVPPACRTLM